MSDADSTQRSQVSDDKVPDYAELMGADEVDTKGDPKRGRRYFWFNLIMILLLSFWVTWNSDWRKKYYDPKAEVKKVDEKTSKWANQFNNNKT